VATIDAGIDSIPPSGQEAQGNVTGAPAFLKQGDGSGTATAGSPRCRTGQSGRIRLPPVAANRSHGQAIPVG